MKAIFFPGQGSQFKGMGKALFAAYPALVATASEILGYSLEELCLNDPRNQLGQTDFTQPALYVVNALSWMEKSSQHGPVDFFAGHSLGEYNALLAAGAFDFETGLRLVKKRGQLMAHARDGGMLAVLQSDLETLRRLLHGHELSGLDIANYNTPSQTILAGPKELIARAEALLADNKVRCMPLNVSAAFHSRYMLGAMQEFANFLTSYSFAPLKTPVIANVNARPYTDETIARLLSKQISSSVQWTDSIRFLMGQAVARKEELHFAEMGQNPVLTRMVQEIQKTQSPLLVEAAPLARAISAPRTLNAGTLGDARFRQDYGIKYAYLSGSMYRGIASKELVVAMGRAGLMGFLGTGGLRLEQIRSDLGFIQAQLSAGQSYGANLLCNLDRPELELATVELLLELGVRRVEAAAFMQITPALVLFRLRGLSRGADGKLRCANQIVGKISRPEVAELFMSPAPERLVARLLEERKISAEQAQWARLVPMAHDICVEADSGGHTDQGVSTVLLPAMQSLRTTVMARMAYEQPIRIGLAGGLGTPQALAAAFTMGADFVLTGSINQCTVESGASDAMKNLLQDINVQDTDYAPAGDMFEIGAQVQVLKKGVFFPARANKLYALYSHYGSLEEIPEKIRAQIEDKYFKRSFASIWEESRVYLNARGRNAEVLQAEANPKRKMSWVFRWYFRYSAMAALNGDEANRVDYQIHTGPALGAFNQWVKGSELESWKNRHVDQIAEKLMNETASLLNQRMLAWSRAT